MWFVDLARAAPITTFVLVCATYYTLKWLIRAPAEFIRARAEARCSHQWEHVRSGKLCENMGEANEKIVGSYALYRCAICGASRQY